MRLKDLTPDVRHIWRVALVVQAVEGLTLGLEYFIWGPLFYEKLSEVTDPATGMMFTAMLIGLTDLASAFLEVPTGAIGDVLGRKWSVVCSYLSRIIFFALLAMIPFCHSMSLVFILGIGSAIAYAFSHTFFSGSFTAWCVDSLRERAPDLGYEHLLARTQTVRSLARLLGGLISIVLFIEHLAYVSFALGLVVSFACAAYCLGEMSTEQTLQFFDRKQVSFATITRRMGAIVGVGFTMFRRSPAVLSLVAIFASFMVLLNLVSYLWPIYLRSQVAFAQQTMYWLGVVVMMSLANATGSHGLTLWTRKWHKQFQAKTHNRVLRHFLVGACVISAGAILSLSWATASGEQTFLWLVLALVALQVAFGVVSPCFETLVNNYIPDTHAGERATILSLASLLRHVLVMLLVIPTGGSSGATTAIGWAIPAGLLVVTTVVGNVFLRRAQSRVPDVFVTREVLVESEDNEKG